VVVGEELERGVFITAQKLLTGDIFGIEKYLPAGTPVNYIRMRDFKGRGQAIDKVLEFAAEAKMRRQVRSAIGQVCEELLMNALYDAPVDEHGQQIFAEVDPWGDAGLGYLGFASIGLGLAIMTSGMFLLGFSKSARSKKSGQSVAILPAAQGGSVVYALTF